MKKVNSNLLEINHSNFLIKNGFRIKCENCNNTFSLKEIKKNNLCNSCIEKIQEKNLKLVIEGKQKTLLYFSNNKMLFNLLKKYYFIAKIKLPNTVELKILGISDNFKLKYIINIKKFLQFFKACKNSIELSIHMNRSRNLNELKHTIKFLKKIHSSFISTFLFHECKKRKRLDIILMDKKNNKLYDFIDIIKNSDNLKDYINIMEITNPNFDKINFITDLNALITHEFKNYQKQELLKEIRNLKQKHEDEMNHLKYEIRTMISNLNIISDLI